MKSYIAKGINKTMVKNKYLKERNTCRKKIEKRIKKFEPQKKVKRNLRNKKKAKLPVKIIFCDQNTVKKKINKKCVADSNSAKREECKGENRTQEELRIKIPRKAKNIR